MPDADTLLDVRELRKHFAVRGGVLSRVRGHVKAVDGVSFRIARGSTLGLVGESGCGKTTVGRTILRLLEPTSGQVAFDNQAVFSLAKGAMRRLRRRMQIVFQDPYGSLNPRRTVSSIVGEPLTIHGIARGRERQKTVEALLDRVGLSPAHARHYPHEFSGGQRQRIGIARALALEPDFIVCDEPVSALDVSIQAQIINLLADLQQGMGISYLFISHDLAVVEHIAHHVAVMYLGRIVETAPKAALYSGALHPYTQALIAAIPTTDPAKRNERRGQRGDVPSLLNPPNGCHFHPRCPIATEECAASVPKLREVAPGHFVRCTKV